MNFVRDTFKNSTPSVPHFEINAFIGNEWVGHYQRNGEWIENVFVREDMRRRGICKKMMMHAISQKKQLRLFVRNNNLEAQRCYRSVGFVPRTGIDDMTEMVYGQIVGQ